DLQVQQMRRQTRVLRRATVGLIVAAIVAIAFVLITLNQAAQQNETIRATLDSSLVTLDANRVQGTRVAQEQATAIADADAESERANSLRLAVEAQNELSSGDPSLLALRLALAAYQVVGEREPPTRVQRIVSNTLYTPGLVRGFSYANAPEASVCSTPESAGDPVAFGTGNAHADEVSAVLVAEQSARVVSGGLDRCVYIWSLETGELLGTTGQLPSRVISMTLHPDEDQFAVGGSSGEITVWTLDGELLNTLEGHDGRVTGMAYDSTGDYLFSGSRDETALLWDLTTGEIDRQLTGSNGRINAVAASPRQYLFVAGMTDGSLYAWDLDRNGDDELDTSAARARPLPQQIFTDPVTSIAFSDDGTSAVMADGFGNILYWDNVEIDSLRAPSPSDEGDIASIVFVGNQFQLIAYTDGFFEVVDFSQGDTSQAFFTESFNLPDQGADLLNVAIGRNGRFAAVGYSNGRVALVDVVNGAVVQRVNIHEFLVQSSEVQPNGTVATRETFGDVVLWRPGTTQEDARRITQEELGVRDGVLMAQGEALLGYMLDMPDEETILLAAVNFETGEPMVYPTDSGFINDPDQLATTTGTLYAETAPLALSPPYQGDPPSLLSQNESLFNRPRVLWNTETGEVFNSAVDLAAYIGETTFELARLNADGTRLAVVSRDNRIAVFAIADIIDLVAGEVPPVLVEFQRERTIDRLVFGTPANPNVLVAGYQDGSVGFLAEGAENWLDLRGHNDVIASLALWDEDGQPFAATTGEDRQLLVWDVNATEAIRDFDMRDPGATLVDYVAADNVLVSQTSTGAAVVWRLDAVDDLIAWAQQNRFVNVLSETDCATFQVEDVCDELTVAEG
ncbi:MAG: WD40 repeat domain-containing protein, partial [Chloroflexota bacterium]